jgi:hypothetical protein
MLKGSGLALFDAPLLPAIDYQIVKQLVRQQVLVADKLLDAKLRFGAYLEDDEAQQLRVAALEALLAAGSHAEVPGDLIDNQLWLNRAICTDESPRCVNCKFMSFCAQDVHLQIPLQLTRHY